MITIKQLSKLAKEAIKLPVGCGNAYLASLQESWCPYLRFMHLLVKIYKPEVAVELGVYNGTCTGHMASANPKTLVVGVDKELRPDALYMKKISPNIFLIEGDTVEMTNTVNWFIEPLKIGLIFLDSTHDGVTPAKELKAYKPYFADECIVAVDDLLGPEHLMVKMQEFWGTLPKEKVELHFLHPVPDTHVGIIDQPGFGVVIIRK